MPDPIRIVLTSTYAWPEVRRGGERYLHEVAAALARRGHAVDIVATAPVASQDTVRGVPVERVARRAAPPRLLGGRGDQLWFGAQALPRVRSRRVDVWHALTLGDAAAAGLLGRLGGPRSVHTALGIPRQDVRGLVGAVHRTVLATVDAYVCLSPRAAGPLRAVGRRPVEVVGAGVDLEQFVPSRERHPVPALLFASDAASPQKNLALLLDAARVVIAAEPALELWLAGPGDVAPVLAAQPSVVRDRVTWSRPATHTELVNLYARAWATVLPSRNEAFGMVALESLAAGTPAVVLAGEGPAAFVDATVGSWAAREDAADLAAACLECVELAAHAGAAAACRARAAEHDWDRAVAPALEQLYAG